MEKRRRKLCCSFGKALEPMPNRPNDLILQSLPAEISDVIIHNQLNLQNLCAKYNRMLCIASTGTENGNRKDRNGHNINGAEGFNGPANVKINVNLRLTVCRSHL